MGDSFSVFGKAEVTDYDWRKAEEDTRAEGRISSYQSHFPRTQSTVTRHEAKGLLSAQNNTELVFAKKC